MKLALLDADFWNENKNIKIPNLETFLCLSILNSYLQLMTNISKSKTNSNEFKKPVWF